jgi:hypothetical protein
MHSWQEFAEKWEAAQNLQILSKLSVNAPSFFSRDVPEPDPVLRMAPEV